MTPKCSISTKSKNSHLRIFVKNLKVIKKKNKRKLVEELIKRLSSSRKCRSIISLSKIIKFSLRDSSRTILTVSKVLNDERIFKTPKLKVFALEFSKSVEKKIINNGGQIFKLDEVKINDLLNNRIFLIRGKKL